MSRIGLPCLAACALAALATIAPAAFAQATIDQNKALAGNVTPGDAAGFPVTLSVPGHYVLKGNLIVPSGTVGVEITAEGVTLDLNGFAVRGSNSCSQNAGTKVVTCTETSAYGPTASGVVISHSTAGNVTVRNGTIQGFRGDGVYGTGGRAKGLTVRHNALTGIHLFDGSASVDDCEASLNGVDGISIKLGLVHRSRSMSNGASGFAPGAGLVQESVAANNRRAGMNGGYVRATVSYGNGNSDVANVVSLGSNAKGNTVY